MFGPLPRDGAEVDQGRVAPVDRRLSIDTGCERRCGTLQTTEESGRTSTADVVEQTVGRW